ncbi:extracellular solute-binding protein [Longispora sp. NPDC051575]|uniref:extracellular solute-binding protein n=1 Tax=Longispora sp. NPDC051575 TaxID=3154943 RepID=UPI00342DE3B8
MRRRALLAAGLAATLLGVAACGDAGSGEATAGGGTLKVWFMEDSVPDKIMKDLNEEFGKQHGVKVTYEMQYWTGIQQKLTKSFADGTGPDVFETGNTQNAAFAKAGALSDLTDKVADLGGQDWLPGLAESGKWDGKQYGVPFYASNRVVVYRKDMFEKAGVTPPKTQDEWLAVAKKLQDTFGASDPAFQPLLLPGSYWFALAGFVWDQGGELAVRDPSGAWKGALDTPQAKAGMRYYQDLFGYSRLAPDSTEDHPRSSDVFAQGKTAMMLSLPLYYKESIAADPSLDGKLGVFPIPGRTAERTSSVFVGGSNVAVPKSSKNQALAYEYVKLMTGEKWQTKLVQSAGNWYVPNKLALGAAVANDPVMNIVVAAAKLGKVPPTDPRWAAVEEEPQIIRQYMIGVLKGGDLDALAAEASAEITRRMKE